MTAQSSLKNKWTVSDIFQACVQFSITRLGSSVIKWLVIWDKTSDMNALEPQKKDISQKKMFTCQNIFWNML